MKHLPQIKIKAIKHKDQRYETVGDYFKKDDWNFMVSKTNSDYEFLIIIHELIEWYLTQKRGIKEKDITKFDIMFEKERTNGKWKNQEPGYDPRAPYQREHTFATKIEKLLSKELDIQWGDYEKTINSL